MIKMPTAFQVSDCVRRLTRRETTVTVLAKPAAAQLPYAGTFHGGDRKVVAMCAADLAFAAFTGAALWLIPAESAQERIRTGVLDEMMQENFAEVLNVLSRLFVVPETTRMALREPIFPPRGLPVMPDPGAAATSIQRADYEIDISGYGVGCLALWGVDMRHMIASPFARSQTDDMEVLARCGAKMTRRHVQGASLLPSVRGNRRHSPGVICRGVLLLKNPGAAVAAPGVEAQTQTATPLHSAKRRRGAHLTLCEPLSCSAAVAPPTFLKGSAPQ